MKETIDVQLKAIALIYSSLLGATGLFFLVESDRLVAESEVYQTLDKVFPFEFYALAFIVSAILLFLSWRLPDEEHRGYMAAGGLTGSICMMIYAAAAFDGSGWTVTFFRYVISAMWLLMIVFVEVAAWIRMYKKKRISSQGMNG